MECQTVATVVGSIFVPLTLYLAWLPFVWVQGAVKEETYDPERNRFVASSSTFSVFGSIATL